LPPPDEELPPPSGLSSLLAGVVAVAGVTVVLVPSGANGRLPDVAWVADDPSGCVVGLVEGETLGLGLAGSGFRALPAGVDGGLVAAVEVAVGVAAVGVTG